MSECIHGRPLYDYCGACASGYGNPDSRGTRDEIADALAITKKIAAAEAEPTGAQADEMSSADLVTLLRQRAIHDSFHSRYIAEMTIPWLAADRIESLQRDIEAARASYTADCERIGKGLATWRAVAESRDMEITRLRAQLASAAAANEARVGLERRIRAALGSHSDNTQSWQSWALQAIRWLESHDQRSALSSDAAANKEREL